MTTLISILIFLIVQSLFNEYAPPQHLGWSIFYFCTLWGCLISICVDRYINSYTKIRRQMFAGLIIPMLYQFILHLSCINKTYIEWYRIVDDRKFELIFVILIILISVYIIITNRKSWVKSLKTIGL